MLNLQILPEREVSLQVLEPVVKTGQPVILPRHIAQNGIYSAKAEGAAGFDPVTVEVDMTSAKEEGYQKGVAETEAKTAWTKYYSNTHGLFNTVVFPENTELIFELHDSCKDVGEMFQSTKNLVSVKLTGNGGTCSTTGMFRYSNYIKKIDFSECNFQFGNWYMAFSNCYALEEIIGELVDSSGLWNNNFTNAFNSCSELKEVRFAKDAIFNTVKFTNSDKLSDASIQSIIDGLKDLTGATTQTLSFHKDVGAKLTPEQKAAITAKNWTLVY